MIWTCKICGQVFDDMFCGDYICDDCFEKMKREEKKQKQRNTPFFRFLSLALAISLMLCIFSGFGIAHADELQEVDTIKVSGKFKEYDVIRFNVGESISSDFLFDFAITNSYSLVYYYLIDFDSDGKIHLYSNNSSGWFLYSELGSLNRAFSFNGSIIDNPNTLSREWSAFYSYSAEGQSYKFKDYDDLSYADGTTTPFSYTDGKSGFTDFLGSEKYLIRVPCSSSSETDKILSSLFTGSQSELVITPSYSQPDKPYIFSSMFPFEIDLSNAVDSGTGLIGIEYKNIDNSGSYIEWFNDKRAINPYLTFDIHDNNFKHNYELIISYNSTIYNDSLFYLSDSYHQANNPFAQWCAANDLQWFFGGISNIDSTGVDTAQAYEIANRIASKNPQNYSFNTSFTLNTSAFDFSSSSGDTFRRIKINLNDYMTVLNTCLYRVQWRDKTDGQIIWTSYFATPDSYNKLTTPNGSLYYDYNYSDYSGDDLLQSLPSDSNKIDDDISSGNIPGNMIDTPTIDENGKTNWSDVDLGGMYSPLNFGLSAVSDFFQSLWVIFPNEIRAIIISGMSLIVVLRILGR